MYIATRMIQMLLGAGLLLAPAQASQADNARERAFAIFNESADGPDDVRIPPERATGSWVVSSKMGASPVAASIAHFNESADGPDDLRGLDGVTVVGSRPAHGAAIFERIRREGLENE